VPGMPTLPANYNALPVLSFFILAIMIVFLYKKLPEAIKGVAMLASIALALIIAPVIFNKAYPALNFGIEDPSKVIFILNFVDAWNYLPLIVIFLLIDLNSFDFPPYNLKSTAVVSFSKSLNPIISSVFSEIPVKFRCHILS